ncbi:MAG: acetate kinase, partial [Epulopiscium sp.]|nr:acetate kinase [Candidatus Epulonipiscium sp.]
MKILVINCGSSSLKYQLIDMTDESVLAKGLCERIGIEGSQLKHTPGDEATLIVENPMPNHTVAVKMVIDALTDENHGVIKNMDEISAVGHRVVHGGEKFSSSVIINDNVKQAIEDCVELAPLHNPANLIGIRACEELMPNTPMVGVFDTAFHQTMPEKAYLYAIPYEMYKKHKVRKYGFHGTSHKYVAQRAAEMLGRPIEDLKIVVCHLG